MNIKKQLIIILGVLVMVFSLSYLGAKKGQEKAYQESIKTITESLQDSFNCKPKEPFNLKKFIFG